MNCQFRIFRRASGVWYIENTATRQQESLRTRVEVEAKRLMQARNEAVRQPAINMQIARAYLSAADPSSVSRTWQFVMDEMAKGKQASTKDRWVRGVAQKPFDHIRNLKLMETRAEHFWHVLTTGTVSTNIVLRRLHNFALDMNWLLAGLIPRRQWAERAKTAGFPQRFAQEALGHKSQAVHAADAKQAQVRVPCLEDWERQMKDKIVKMEFNHTSDIESSTNKSSVSSEVPPVLCTRCRT
jgi:hypothetical protein